MMPRQQDTAKWQSGCLVGWLLELAVRQRIHERSNNHSDDHYVAAQILAHCIKAEDIGPEHEAHRKNTNGDNKGRNKNF